MPLTGKYLKYSPKITLEIFTLIWDKLSEAYESHSNGVEVEYNHAFKKNNGFLRLINHSSKFGVYYSKEHLIETTVQEILGYDPFVKEDFVLPEKWCIKHTNNKELHKFFEEYNHGGYNNSSTNFLHYPRYDGSKCLSPIIKFGYTEITFEQFKKYVLKESVEKPKQQLAVFPSEGFCKTDSVELRGYLKNKFPNYTQKNWDKKYTIIAWNSVGYWWCEERSGKPEYTLEQLKPFFNVKEEIISEYVECIENVTKNPVGIELGKIYKVLSKVQCNCKTNSDIYLLDCKGAPNKTCWDCNKKLPDNAYMASRFKPST